VHMEDVRAFAPDCIYLFIYIEIRIRIIPHRSVNGLYALKGQSSPGVLQEGQQASNATRQIPQRSSSLSSLLLLLVVVVVVVSWGCWGSEELVLLLLLLLVLRVSQRHWAMAFQRLTITFIVSSRIKANRRCL